MQTTRRLFLFALFALSAFASVTFAQSRVRTFDAEHYVIKTSFDRAAKTVFGETTIRLKPLANGFKDFAVDAAKLKIESITLENDAKPLKFSAENNKLLVSLDKVYSPAETVAVTIKYSAVAPEAGMYFVDEEKEDGKVVRPAQIWTQGEPEDNRFWFPSYDYPDDKATSEQFITVNADETAIANGELVEVNTNADGKTKTFHYKVAVPHSTYLTSLIVSKYTRVEDKYNDIPLTFNVYPGTESIVPIAYGKTKKMFAFYENKLGVKYPYKKYDQTVVSAFIFGGMENITATTMADTEIYAARDKGFFRSAENLVSHELSHSWFGNLVTCKSWSELWLNEGFATFFESAFIESEYGHEEYLKEMRTNAAQYFMEETFIKHPLQNPKALPNILLFDATTYKKGGVVVHMLRETVGDEIFWKALNNYLNRHRFGNVESSDLQAVFEETSGKKLDWFFNQWVKSGGYPKLKVTPTYNAKTKKLTLDVKQTQTVVRSEGSPVAAFRFSAEVEVITPQGAKIEKIEMTEREQVFTFDSASKPTKINFDKREQVLKKLDMAAIK